jgi:Hg(II)-responsive transcriptional regulator
MRKSTNSRLTIGKVAKLSEVGVETIRFYEREGIIEQPKRSSGSFREYPEDTIRRLHFIKRTRELGFSLAEVTELLSLRVKGRSTCATIKNKAESKISQVEKKIADLNRIRAALVRVKNTCDKQAPTDTCPVLESFYV